MTRYRKPIISDHGGNWSAQFRDLDGTKRHVSQHPRTCPLVISSGTFTCRSTSGDGKSRRLGRLRREGLRPILRLTVKEGHLKRYPAELPIISPEAPRPIHRSMSFDEARLFFSVLELGKKVIGGLAVWIPRCLDLLPRPEPEAWLFPSERIITPLSKDNNWRRYFLPRLTPAGLERGNFQEMRRTYSSLSDELEVGPQVRADRMGHTVEASQNSYSRSSLERRRHAVNALEKELGLVQ